jgi:hypothetical protein
MSFGLTPQKEMTEEDGENFSTDLSQSYYFPAELIGGSSPYVKGEEEAMAWQAAAEACDSERIHFVHTASEGRVWYLAVRSMDLASHPKSWCPFAPVLPGLPDARPSPVIYTHYSDEAAALMAVHDDSLQVIRGTTSIIRAKAERMAREMNNAELVDLVPDVIVNLKPQPWQSLSLLEDRARRFLAITSALTGVAITIGSFFIWLLASITSLAYHANLTDLQARTHAAAVQLQQSATVLRTSEMREQLAAFSKLNENLINLQGWLKLYILQDGKVKWWAVVPSNLTSAPIQDLGAQTLDTTDDGIIIANSKESYMHKNQFK